MFAFPHLVCSGVSAFKVHLRDFPGGAVVENLPVNAGDTDLTPHAVEQLSLCATTTEPHSRDREPQLLSPCTTTTEACMPRARVPQQEEPPQGEACTPQR